MLRSVLVTAVLAFSASAYAQDVNYNYLQGSWGQVEFDDAFFDVDGDGFGIAGSFAVNDNWHIFGDYQTAGLDFGVDLSIFEAGFGYNTTVSENLDLLVRAGYVNVEADAPGIPSESDDGYSFGVDLRSMVSEKLELNGGLGYVDSSDSSGETRFRAGFLYDVGENFSLGADGTWWDDVNVYRLTARFNF